MVPPASQHSDVELQRQRESILRGLFRANAAAGVILCIVIVFAVAAVIAAWRADQSARALRVASQQAENELWKSRLAEARALRLSGEVGRRQRALKALREAARVQPTLELRNEAVACLALTDLEKPDQLHHFPLANTPHAVDAALQRFAFGHTNGDISVHQFSDGRELQRLPRPAGHVPSNALPARLQFSPTGERLAVVYTPGYGGFFDLASGKFLGLSISARLTLETIAFSADARWLALVRRSGARLYDLHEGARVGADVPWPDLVSVSFHPNTNWIALAGGRLTQIREWPEGGVVHSFTNAQTVAAVRFRPDGRQLAVASSAGVVTLWNLDTLEPMELKAPVGGYYQFDYSASGRYVCAALGEAVSTIWDANTGEPLHKMNDSRVLRFAADDARIAFEQPREGLGICQFSAPGAWRKLEPPKPHDGDPRLWSVDFSADGQTLAAAHNREFMVWDVPTGSLRSTTRIPSRRLTTAWSAPLNGWVTAGHGGVSIWPGSGTRRDIGLSIHPSLGQAALAPDERQIAVVTNAGDVVLVDLEAQTQFAKLHGPSSLGHLAFSPDAKFLASSATTDYGLVVWDVARGKMIQQIRGEHGRVAWSPDGQWVVLGTAQDYSFWRTDCWQQDETRTVPRGNLSTTTGSIAYSKDGGMLALVRNRDLVQLFDPVSGREVTTLTAPEPQAVSWLRFSRDGASLAVATVEGAIQLWNLPALREQLAALNLDWGRAPVTIPNLTHHGSRITPFLVLTLLGVPLALAAGIFAFGRQRHLWRGYLQMDTLAAERSRELVRAQKMKALGTLAAGVAHDFNNLLSVVRMSNQLTAEAAPGNPDIAENATEIERAVDQGKKLVRSMLGYSREDHDEHLPLDLPEVVEDTVALLTKQFLSGITLTLELDRNTPQIQGSRSRLEQILLNLIVNAAEAMEGRGALRIIVRQVNPPTGPMILRPRPAAHYIELAIEDSGPGIPADILPRIFEPFFTTKNRGAIRGTGLGLSTVYTMAEQDGLGISVDTVLGRGTTFRIFIPG